MIFWIVVASLLLVAIVWVILPILKRPTDDEANDRQQQNIDIARTKKLALEQQLSNSSLSQDEFDSSLHELQTALALDLERTETRNQNPQGKWVIWLLLVALPLASIGLYFRIGEYRVIGNPSLASVAAPNTQAQHNNMTLDQMLEVVKKRLQENPEDARGWFVLGKTMMEKGQFEEAVTAFQRTLDIVGDREAGVLFSLADALSMQKNGDMQGEPEALIQRGLEIEPQNSTGIWLAGLAAEQRQDYKAAFGYMNELLPLIANDAQSTNEVRRVIADLQERDPTLKVVAQEPVVGRSLKVSVSLAENLRQQVASGDAVFVYAKAMKGPPMPLAVKRLTVADLPIDVELSDADAMIPSMKLSSFETLIVGARVSKSGNPVAQVGDFYIEIDSVESDALVDGLTLTISETK
jgi:cytochrome c-type biogenesis protein CcmH